MSRIFDAFRFAYITVSDVVSGIIVCYACVDVRQLPNRLDFLRFSELSIIPDRLILQLKLRTHTDFLEFKPRSFLLKFLRFSTGHNQMYRPSSAV